MKFILIVNLLILISCTGNNLINTEEKSNSVTDFYQCLLLDSDVVQNAMESIIDAIKTLKPSKLVGTFLSVYPKVVAEVGICAAKSVNFNSNSNNLFSNIIDIINVYVLPFLRSLGIQLKGLCVSFFPDLFLCEFLPE